MVGTNVANISVSYVNIARIPFFGLEADLALDAFFILFILFFSPLFIYNKHWAAMNIALFLCFYTLETTSSIAQRFKEYYIFTNKQLCHSVPSRCMCLYDS
ncbi:hypothetical protein E4T42_04396 [Aureobasidium subglaciale]|nr:hypothetical protein E4T42_04396 [Aureobasidium subglaciale]